MAAIVGAFALGYAQGGLVLGLFLSGLGLWLGGSLMRPREAPQDPNEGAADREEKSPPLKGAEDAPSPPEGLTSEQKQVFLQVTTSPHPAHLVTGPAGSGKTTLLYALQDVYKGRSVTLAPTGTAALQARGQTVHAFFRFPARLLRYRHLEDIPLPGARSPLRRALERMEVLILDEVGMVRVDLLEAIDWALRKTRRRPEEPFGGVKVLLLGDTRQLEPVVPNGEEALYIARTWGGPFFFQARVWEEVALKVHHLQESQRQREDPMFAELLRRLRQGDLKALEDLNRKAVKPQGAEEPGALILTPRRKEAEAINLRRLEALPGEPLEYTAQVHGTFAETDYPTEATLHLKKGAQVILLRNDPAGAYFNGDLGWVEDLEAEALAVRLKRTKQRVVIRPFIWEKIAYTYDPKEEEIRPQVVGTFRQMPVRLAWALTVHKAQGLTLERVHLELGRGLFAHGQLYVALTRVRRLEDLSLSRPLAPGELLWRPEVEAFERHIQEGVWKKAGSGLPLS